jgi:hypothetical protein
MKAEKDGLRGLRDRARSAIVVPVATVKSSPYNIVFTF